jgi:hypothetical protein
MIPWLLRAGHSPGEAEQWVSQYPSWTAANPAHIDLHARYLAEQWGQHPSRYTEPWITEYADLIEQWAAHRLR